MPIVTGVRFKNSGRTYFFNPLEFDIKSGDSVIVETARGIEYGDVVIGPREVDESEVVAPLKNVIRIATENDAIRLAQNKEKQKEAYLKCEEKIEHHKLPMKLVDVEYTFDRKKILFYFTSDGRVDFRELVKDLAATFKTRIELRQIGVRDEAKLLGGLGSCGREVCCKSFLGDFRPVSIKMAKDQGISLNPTKISGLCGRLMCCLEYEHSFYKEAKKLLRKHNSTVITPKGPGYVLDNLMLQEKCKVKVILPGDNFEVVNFKYEELKDLPADEIDAQIEKIKAMPANNNSFNNPYETWDDDAIEHQNNKPKDGGKNRNKNYRKKSFSKNKNNKNNRNSYNTGGNNNNRNTNNDKKSNIPSGDNKNTTNSNSANNQSDLKKSNNSPNKQKGNFGKRNAGNGSKKSSGSFYRGKAKYNSNKTDK